MQESKIVNNTIDTLRQYNNCQKLKKNGKFIKTFETLDYLFSTFAGRDGTDKIPKLRKIEAHAV